MTRHCTSTVQGSAEVTLAPRFPASPGPPSYGSMMPGSWEPAPVLIPRQVRDAARLMYVGAVIGAAGLLYYGFKTSPSSVPQTFHFGNRNTVAYHAGFVLGAVLFAALVAGLWVWM